MFPFLTAYLGSLSDPEVTELLLNEYRTATNMTEQFAALVAIEQKPGEIRDQVLADFYNKWQHDFLVCLHCFFFNRCSAFCRSFFTSPIKNLVGFSFLIVPCIILDKGSL